MSDARARASAALTALRAAAARNLGDVVKVVRDRAPSLLPQAAEEQAASRGRERSGTRVDRCGAERSRRGLRPTRVSQQARAGTSSRPRACAPATHSRRRGDSSVPSNPPGRRWHSPCCKGERDDTAEVNTSGPRGRRHASEHSRNDPESNSAPRITSARIQHYRSVGQAR
jgi:hypothetical protein